MPNYIFEVLIALMFLFFGIKYLRTREFDDKKDIYTEESKRKAALVYGIFFIFAAILEGVIVAMKYTGNYSYSGDNLVMSLLPSIGIIGGVIIVILIVYLGVLKKK